MNGDHATPPVTSVPGRRVIVQPDGQATYGTDGNYGTDGTYGTRKTPGFIRPICPIRPMQKAARIERPFNSEMFFLMRCSQIRHPPGVQDGLYQLGVSAVAILAGRVFRRWGGGAELHVL